MLSHVSLFHGHDKNLEITNQSMLNLSYISYPTKLYVKLVKSISFNHTSFFLLEIWLSLNQLIYLD